MNGKSSRNQEIVPLASFSDGAVPLGEPFGDDGRTTRTTSINEPIHPLADFRDQAVAFDPPGQLTPADKAKRKISEA